MLHILQHQLMKVVQMAALSLLMLAPFFFAVAESQSTTQLNHTDFEAAMADMRAKSYLGFVILLKVLPGSPNFVLSSDVTFLMPNGEKLSAPELSLDHLRNFVHTHTIPSPLVFNSSLHFPNGTLVPSGVPGKMLAITTNHGLLLNNARIVNANVCVNSLIKCHGISSAISFKTDHGDGDGDEDGDGDGDGDGDAPSPPPPPTANNVRAMDPWILRREQFA